MFLANTKIRAIIKKKQKNIYAQNQRAFDDMYVTDADSCLAKTAV